MSKKEGQQQEEKQFKVLLLKIIIKHYPIITYIKIKLELKS